MGYATRGWNIGIKRSANTAILCQAYVCLELNRLNNDFPWYLLCSVEFIDVNAVVRDAGTDETEGKQVLTVKRQINSKFLHRKNINQNASKCFLRVFSVVCCWAGKRYTRTFVFYPLGSKNWLVLRVLVNFVSEQQGEQHIWTGA